MAKKNEKPKANGRPREHNREQIFIDLIEWADKPDSINLCKFCSTYKPKIAASKLMQWAREDDNFRLSYEIAKQSLGYRREEWLNGEMLHVKAYDLNAKAYDPFLKDEHRQECEFQASLKKEEEQKASPFEDVIALRHDNMFLKDQLAKLQDQINANKS